MKALSVVPGRPRSAELIDVQPPAPASDGSMLVRSLAIGICGTDAEIVDGQYGEAPPGEERLILGHESLGEVVEAAPGSGFAPGQLVVGVVRRPDPEPCDHCARDEWDMCRNGLYTECGIKASHGYARELYRLDPHFAVPVDAALGDLGVLVEPASVVAKAAVTALHILQRSTVPPKTVLITGAGPIGLLAALASRQRGLDTYVIDVAEGGPKPALVRAIGAAYHAGSVSDLAISPEAVIECTGVGAVVQQAVRLVAPGGVVALTGISAVAAESVIDLNLANKNMVLTNKVLFGSVNAARSHYELAARMLCRADPAWLRCLISRRVPLRDWREAIGRQPDDVKVVLDMTTPV